MPFLKPRCPGFRGLLSPLLLAGAAFAHTNSQPDALHAIILISFGPTSGDLTRVVQLGVDRYSCHSRTLADGLWRVHQS